MEQDHPVLRSAAFQFPNKKMEISIPMFFDVLLKLQVDLHDIDVKKEE